MQMKDKVVGIAGMGRIGKATAKLFKAIGARVIGYDHKPSPEEQEQIEYSSDFKSFLSQVDVLSLHMPATADNYHILNAQSLAYLPRGAIIINTARGSLIDTTALLAALDTGALAGVAMDCYEAEDAIINKQIDLGNIDKKMKRILANEKILYTPHIAYYTDEAVRALVLNALDSIVCLYEAGETEAELR
ncbi:MAG: NAD(P)-dependent oxidoreductase [Eubacteriales bacterium]|nr:NAD(P)-dependent oxidoreductase [Eubacteriales bacterium]